MELVAQALRGRKGATRRVVLTLAALATAAHLHPVRASGSRLTLEEALRRYPPTETNSAALDLERLAAPLGIDLVPKDVKDRARPRASEVAAFENVWDVLWAWLKTELARASRDTSEEPVLLRDFLAKRSRPLAALRAGILKGEPPTWAQRIDDGRHRESRPSLMRILSLHGLLITDGLIQSRAGRPAVALEDLEASWKLHEGYASSPFFDCRFFAMSAFRFEAGVLRRIDAVPSLWRDRLRSVEPVTSTFEALRLGTIVALVDLDSDTFGITGPFAGTRRAIDRAYRR